VNGNGKGVDSNQRLYDVFALGYENGVWDTMKEHDVFTNPINAGLRCHELIEKDGDKLVEAYYSGGDIMSAIPTEKL